jgi:TatD DNase family protein
MTASPAVLADTHCHLSFSAFRGDFQAVLKRAAQAGIDRILVPGIDLESSEAAIRLAEQHAPIYASVGLHPHHASGLDDEVREKFALLAASPKVVAIGEIGLDYYRNLSPKKAQLEAFEWQLELARQLELPVVIHCREAIGDVSKILLKWSKSLPAGLNGRSGVMHAYSYNGAHANSFIEAGFYIGIAGPVTYRKAEALRQTVSAIRMDRLLTETDAPYLTPHPFRGKRNEPAHVRLVAEEVSKIHQLSLLDVAAVTFANARALFKWSHELDNGYLQ